jgi:hypothetical protein
MHYKVQALKARLTGTADYFMRSADVHKYHKGWSKMQLWRFINDPLFPGFPISRLKFDEWVKIRKLTSQQVLPPEVILNYLEGWPKTDKSKWEGFEWDNVLKQVSKYYPSIPKESLSGWLPEDAVLMESLSSHITPVTLRKLNQKRRESGISILKPPISMQILALYSRIALRKQTGAYYTALSQRRSFARNTKTERWCKSASTT